MNIAVVGTGYVGLVSAACFAELGHTVIGVDIDKEKVRKLKNGECTIYEPGLEEVLQRNLKSGRLSFTTDLTEALPAATVVFSAVATPPNEDFSADLKAVFIVAETVAQYANHDLVFVNKSTVPVGTGKECEQRIQRVLDQRGEKYRIPVVSNPEFLREGCAVRDTLEPDRIVVGINGNNWARKLMDELYHPLTRVGKPLLYMDRESAEIVKYASNGFLATKISFINMLSELCEKTGGNIRDIAQGMGLDDRIGPRFLHAGIGYGGSCFPKDVKALIALSNETGIPLPIVQATHDINDHQRKRFFDKFLSVLPASATVGIWGLSFKPKTDDMREAPSLDLIPMLTKAGHTVRVHDPIAMENAKKIIPDIEYAESPMAAAKDADAVIVLTEWDVFRGADLHELARDMKGPHLFDGRNIYEPKEVRDAGLTYYGIGIS
ncbi:UDP-glucose 6-dehydrogenase [Candidatus Peregrinibacteria bacterium CG10_big_fil_rev_8_21_14_0_10_49_24]|nr:MAG: UDP-glucose 6-dehydrogenase [Candidatus Peregrinibacteria bacterium CG11_big_fil_rev_8_21_14_0_20_49_14]PIR51519.1 MAG: UDP-glucose 6-dehydrogenase [Candidatus Peregrinibacteria bacterium CG10_big_fil_rev_8_21_14_0_10_49_24]PJA67838.1 MAG: UDP-glucose 6-dehydrogenase [Candidatus Peregrinibacteria bacterium CG_4_9_14_3_um_filter_49_12]